MYYVYVLQSLKTLQLYKGFTNDIDRRWIEHIRGSNSATKHMLPVQLVHVELCESRFEARALEKFFKSGYGRETLKEIVSYAQVVKW